MHSISIRRLHLITIFAVAVLVYSCGGDEDRIGDRFSDSGRRAAVRTAKGDSSMRGRKLDPSKMTPAMIAAMRDSARQGRLPSGDGSRMAPAQQRGHQMGGSAVAIPVEIDRIIRKDMVDYILASTTVEALREVEVFAQTTGIIEKLNVEEGDNVSAGDTLVVLDDREAGLNLRRAEISLSEAKNTLDRAREMISKNLISMEEFETTQLAYRSAENGLDEAELAYRYTRVTAPISGTITERQVFLGDMISQGKVLFRLADFDPLRARVFIPEKDLRRLRIGQEAILAVESEPGREFPAVVKLISSVIDPSSGTFKVTLEIDRSDGVLRPGMFASVRIVVDTHPAALVVPAEAVLYEGQQRYIYTIHSGKAQRIDVNAGFVGGGEIEITGPVGEGDPVVIAGHNNLASGASVEIVKDASGAAVSADEISPTGGAGSGSSMRRTQIRQDGR